MEAGDLADFKANASYYEMCANMIYAGGERDWNVVAFGDMIGKGNFSGAGRQLGNIWAGALQSPDFWLTAAFLLGAGPLNLNAKGINNLLRAGNALDRGGYTAVGRALQKHAVD